ncbi:MAG: DUF6391 domain-containing protein [Dehalococcoidia bacterium]|nr:DUF6391 domain-containing protein [Dehalococcoidia bacterium]
MELPVIDSTRRNHALEHATITVLLHRLGPSSRLMGRSTARGFYIYGDIPTVEIMQAAHEGLARLQRGEAELAVSPLCGTNLAVGGILAGFASLLALSGKQRSDRLSRAILASTVALVLAQPLGRLVQKHLTTSAQLQGVKISAIIRQGSSNWVVHKIETTYS